jgi:hypothetical protein
MRLPVIPKFTILPHSFSKILILKINALVLSIFAAVGGWL